MAHHPAKIVLGPEAMISCTIKDISTGGARIAVKRTMDLPENFELFIAAHDLQVRRARVCWRNGDFAGVAFGLDEADERPAAHPAQLHPFQDCLDEAALSVNAMIHPSEGRLDPRSSVPAAPERKNLSLYRTTA